MFNELLAKDAIKLATGSAGFYSNVFVVLRYMDGLCPILNLKQFSCYMHIPIYKMPTIKQV